jgi:hypothetical protein
MKIRCDVLDVWGRLAETLNTVAHFPLTTLLKKLYAFEALEDVAFNYESFGTLEAFML